MAWWALVAWVWVGGARAQGVAPFDAERLRLNPGAAGAKTLTATAIQGGSPRKVTKGDYIFVPANTPHQYTDIQGELITVAVHMPVATK